MHKTRQVHECLEKALQQISFEDAERLRGTLGSTAADALPGMNVDALLASSGGIDTQASAGFARVLLASAQWQPATYAAADAADANDAAADPVTAGVNDPWLKHPAFQLVDSGGAKMIYGQWLDQKLLLLLSAPSFRSEVVQWADACKGRPPTAEPADLVARARRARELLARGTPAGAEPVLLDKARLSLAAIFGAEAREGEDANRALQHLHRKPCKQADKPTCTLCTVHWSFSRRFKALVKTQAVQLPEHAMFDVRDSRPVAMSWCAAPPRRAGAATHTRTHTRLLPIRPRHTTHSLCKGAAPPATALWPTTPRLALYITLTRLYP